MHALLIGYAVSGFVSLGYQVVWLRHFVDRFGSGTFTFVLVIANFILGLGVGALLSRRLTHLMRRITSGGVHPRRFVNHRGVPGGSSDDLRIYGLFEVLITLAACLMFVESLLPAQWLGSFPYVLRDGVYEPRLAYQLARIPLAAATVFVPSLLMGVTFPLLCHAFVERVRLPSALYACNTAGACAAVLVCEFVLLRSLGTDRTFYLMLALNGLLGLTFMVVGRRLQYAYERIPTNTDVERFEKSERPVAEAALSVILLGAMVSGFLSGALEADVMRRVRFVQHYSGAALAFISFWAIAAIFLGSWIIHRKRHWRLSHIKAAYAAALIYHLAAGYVLFPARSAFDRAAASFAARLPWLDPDGSISMLGSVFALTGLAIFPSFLAVSLLLPYLCNAAQKAGRHLGPVYGLNTLAFLLGLVAFGWVAPRVNTFYAFKLFVAAFVVLVAWLALQRQAQRVRAWSVAAASVALLAAVGLTPRGFDYGYFPRDYPIKHQKVRAIRSDSAHMTYVAEDPYGDRLYFDSFSMSATSPEAQRYMRLMAHAPLLAHPQPRRALLVCFGVGNTASAIAKHGTIEQLDVVDLSRNVFETAPEFARYNDLVYVDPRVRLIHDDGRNFLNLTDAAYDLITSEPPPPLMHGVGRLYSVEFYRAVMERLTDRGLMTQWVPLYQMPPAAARWIIGTFVQSFPYALLMVGAGEEFILIGSRYSIDLAGLERRFHDDSAVVSDLRDIWAPTPAHLLARVVMTDAAMRERFGGEPPITDQRNPLSAQMYAGRTLRLTYKPLDVLEALKIAGVRSAGVESALTHVARLRGVVPDFPVRLLAAMEADPRRVMYADVDWQKLDGQNRRAHEAMSAGRDDEAAALYGESLRMVPIQLDVFLNRGVALAARGRPREAALWFERAVEAFPEYQHVQMLLARALSEADDLDAAMHRLSGMISSNPRNAAAHVLLGDLLIRRGDTDNALRHYQRALELKPGWGDVREKIDAATHQSEPRP
jgi:spermidine synthase